MAVIRASTGVDTAGVDKVLRDQPSPNTSVPSTAMADSDTWPVGLISTASGTDGIYVIRSGVNALIFSLSGTTVTVVAQNASVFSVAGVNTASKINLYAASGVLTVQNLTGGAITPRIQRLS